MTDAERFRLTSVKLDERTVVHRSRQIEQEREIAIYDLLEGNSFQLAGSESGPYHLVLGIEENRLVFDVHLEDETAHGKVMLSLTPFRSVIKDYFLICDSYFKAIRTAPPSQIEALDMARRASHNDGSTLLKERLGGKIDVDFDTARRLFTLICVLHLKG